MRDDTSPDAIVEYPPVVRAQVTPVSTRHSLPSVRPRRELGLASVILASGLALAIEGLRLAARSNRNRATSRALNEPREHVMVTYEWTQITVERYERS